MPNLDDMFDSKYLKRGDVTPPKIMTIRKFTKIDLARQGEEPQYKWTCEFEESPKPLVCNKTNLKRMAKVFDSENTDNWIGKKVEVYFDENVEMAGDIVGGIRVRKPSRPAGQTTTGRRVVTDVDLINEEMDDMRNDDLDR